MESRLKSDKRGESQTLLWSARTCLGFKISSQILGAAKGHKVSPQLLSTYLAKRKFRINQGGKRLKRQADGKENREQWQVGASRSGRVIASDSTPIHPEQHILKTTLYQQQHTCFWYKRIKEWNNAGGIFSFVYMRREIPNPLPTSSETLPPTHTSSNLHQSVLLSSGPGPPGPGPPSAPTPYIPS